MPPSHKLTMAEVFDSKTGKPNHERLKQHFVQEGRIEDPAALKIINDGAALLRAERTMIDIEAPVTGIPHMVIISPFTQLRCDSHSLHLPSQIDALPFSAVKIVNGYGLLLFSV